MTAAATAAAFNRTVSAVGVGLEGMYALDWGPAEALRYLFWDTARHSAVRLVSTSWGSTGSTSTWE